MCSSQLRFARELGCPKVDTTDSGRVYDMSKEDVFKQTILNYQECLKWAGGYKIIINVEPHGPYTGYCLYAEAPFHILNLNI